MKQITSLEQLQQAVRDKHEDEGDAEALEMVITIGNGIHINYDFYAPMYGGPDSLVDPQKWEILDYSTDETEFLTNEELMASRFGDSMRSGHLFALIS